MQTEPVVMRKGGKQQEEAMGSTQWVAASLVSDASWSAKDSENESSVISIDHIRN